MWCIFTLEHGLTIKKKKIKKVTGKWSYEKRKKHSEEGKSDPERQEQHVFIH